ncbi:unnamed protein product [Prunus armeniaca]|uniref:Uncharacterized protein n=1 Tax=Prunus armeniaca TaxID=36596 RepID=A0A6J5TI82_PRUAR|nr:unnamed protein product [Prunus armeniaca]CAB4294212.1 unnamed protein product [Prunus armeniaca]
MWANGTTPYPSTRDHTEHREGVGMGLRSGEFPAISISTVLCFNWHLYEDWKSHMVPSFHLLEECVEV